MEKMNFRKLSSEQRYILRLRGVTIQPKTSDFAHTQRVRV